MKALFPRALCALPLLTLALSGCGGGSSKTPDGPSDKPTASYTLSGNVLVGSGQGQVQVQTQVQSLSLGQQAARWQAPHVAGQVLVLGQVPGGMAGKISAQSLDVAGQTLSVVTTPTGRSDQAYAAELSAQGLEVQPNYLYSPLALAAPNDPGYPGNAGVGVNGKLYQQDYLTRIDALAGWTALGAASKPLSGTLSAFLDTGVNFAHPDLQGRLLDGADCSAAVLGSQGLSACKVASGAAEDISDDKHGTATAGIMGASSNNGLGLTGLTWAGKNLLPVKVFDTSGYATTTSLAAGVAYAVSQGAGVINMSLGLPGTLDAGLEDQILAQALAQAASADVLLVAAAGNTPDQGLYYPASDPNVLAVGAVGNTDDLACYSARPEAGQKALDLVAPGGDAGSSTGRCEVLGQDDILTLTPGGYTLHAGTSEAAPMVAGAASLMRGANPSLSAAQVATLLKSSAKPVSGGPLLDVGAAVQAALNTVGDKGTQGYTLKVAALRGGSVYRSYTSSGAGAVPSSLPYTLSGLPAGSYQVQATLSYATTTLSGQQTVTLKGDQTQDITVQ